MWHSGFEEATHSMLWKFYNNFIYFNTDFILIMLVTVSNFIIYVISIMLVTKGVRSSQENSDSEMFI